MWHIWLILSGIFLIAEVATVGFLLFWFAIGSLIAMIVSIFLPEEILMQSIIFLISSTSFVFLTRKLANKLFKGNTASTNVYKNIGKQGIVTMPIDPEAGTGQIKVNGEVWSAKSEEDIPIEKGTKIEVTKIEGVKALVKAIS